MEVVLSQPALPPHCDSSPRRLPAIGTRSDEREVLRAENQSTEREGFFLLQAIVNAFLHVSCTSPGQEWILLQEDVGANVEKTTDSEQAAAREEFARPSKKRMTA